MAHITDHMINVTQKNDVYGLKEWWYVDDNFGNLTPVSMAARANAHYFFYLYNLEIL